MNKSSIFKIVLLVEMKWLKWSGRAERFHSNEINVQMASILALREHPTASNVGGGRKPIFALHFYIKVDLPPEQHPSHRLRWQNFEIISVVFRNKFDLFDDIASQLGLRYGFKVYDKPIK